MQISMFDGSKPFKIDKPIRLIELFAGIGAQAKALKNLGANFERYRAVEIDKYAVKSYNSIHGTNFDPMDITKIHAEDLAVRDTDKYCYIMTYSFPCQDLSVAGKQSGMAKGSGTRSGLLWEVERLLTEMRRGGQGLPQVLLMENVPEVIGERNAKHFAEWVKFLDGLGYKSKWDLLNAKDFGVPQNRNRCFMVSVLGDYYYDFPQGKPLEKRLIDVLQVKVDERYYIKGRTIQMLINHAKRQAEKGNGFKFEPSTGGGYAHSILTRPGERPCDNFIIESGQTDRKRNGDSNDVDGERLQRVWQSSNDRSNRVEIISRPHGYNKGGITQSEVYPTVRKSSTEQGNNGIIEKWQI